VHRRSRGKAEQRVDCPARDIAARDVGREEIVIRVVDALIEREALLPKLELCGGRVVLRLRGLCGRFALRLVAEDSPADGPGSRDPAGNDCWRQFQFPS
jgi:hypothetical protein